MNKLQISREKFVESLVISVKFRYTDILEKYDIHAYPKLKGYSALCFKVLHRFFPAANMWD